MGATFQNWFVLQAPSVDLTSCGFVNQRQNICCGQVGSQISLQLERPLARPRFSDREHLTIHLQDQFRIKLREFLFICVLFNGAVKAESTECPEAIYQ
jgi:hypothetical protein